MLKISLMINLFTIITQKKYFAVAQLFLSLSLIFGTWVIYIPTIKEKLHLSEGDLGIVLLFSAIGAFLSLPFGKYFVSILGEGKLALISIVLFALAVVGNFIAESFFQLCLFLFLNGMSASFLQIGMNSIVSTLEKRDNVAIMSSCHGFFSLGGIVASGFGTMLLILFNNPFLHIITVASLVVILQISFFKRYIYFKNEAKNESQSKKLSINKLKNSTLWLLAVVALCVMVSEGAIADWSALFLRDIALTKTEFVGLGYAGFSVTMTIGRFLGDYWSKKYGALIILIGGYFISILGMLLVLASTTYMAILGFAVVGLGFSTIVPEIYRMSSNIKGIDPSTGIAFMAGAGFFGFLAGPVGLGFVAQEWGLHRSFIIILGLVFLGLFFSIFISSRFKSNHE